MSTIDTLVERIEHARDIFAENATILERGTILTAAASANRNAANMMDSILELARTEFAA